MAKNKKQRIIGWEIKAHSRNGDSENDFQNVV